MPTRTTRVTAAQPPTDLSRRPVPGQLAGYRVAQPDVDGALARLGPPAAQVRLIVRIPRLITPVGLAVSVDLPVDGLVAPADPRGDRLDRIATMEPVSDLDPVVLAHKPRADR